MRAIMVGVGVVEVLLRAGANVHASDDKALRFASTKGHVSVVELLLEAGADVHALGDWALRYANENGHVGVVIKLVEAGASLNVLGECWVKLFGCSVPVGLAKMKIDEITKLILASAIEKELIG